MYFCCNIRYNYPRKFIDSLFDRYENKKDYGIKKDSIYNINRILFDAIILSLVHYDIIIKGNRITKVVF